MSVQEQPLPRKTTSVDQSGASPTAHPLYVGTSGWAYPSWKPDFYPSTVSAKKFLAFYASQLNSVEVNYTFRKLPTPSTIDRWLAETPAGFHFSFKAPQRMTHFNRLQDCDGLVEDFFNILKPVAAAGKLGPVLFQLPPNFKPDLTRLRNFLAAPAFCHRDVPRLAFEFRHPGWFSEETTALLRRRNAAYCIAETDELVTPELHTAADFTCFRLRRAGGYPPGDIEQYARLFRTLAAERDVFIYFKHEEAPTGALNACALRQAAA